MNEIHELIKQKAKELHAEIIEHRRYLHQHPELSYQEFETMEYVCKQLEKWNISFTKGIAGTGIVAFIQTENQNLSELERQDNSCIALRGDMDALPIQEENEHDYKSKNDGIMHACGHDVHTSILLGTAKILQDLKDKLPQSVKLIFQPGEEKNPGGASLMIAENVLENPKVKEIYALHVFPDMPVGEVGFKEGLYMASCDEIYIHLKGKGGHGATPHQTTDSIFIGSTLVTSLQNIVSRRCDPKIPCVLSFGHFEALGATNIIPSNVYIKGTFRTMNEAWRKEALELIENQVKQIVAGLGGEVEIEISKGYPFLTNDPVTTKKLSDKAIGFLGAEKVHDLPIRLTAEDFSFYSQKIPACFFRLGVRNEEKGIVHGVHNSKFDIDEDALRIGMEMMTLAVF